MGLDGPRTPLPQTMMRRGGGGGRCLSPRRRAMPLATAAKDGFEATEHGRIVAQYGLEFFAVQILSSQVATPSDDSQRAAMKAILAVVCQALGGSPSLKHYCRVAEAKAVRELAAADGGLPFVDVLGADECASLGRQAAKRDGY